MAESWNVLPEVMWGGVGVFYVVIATPSGHYGEEMDVIDVDVEFQWLYWLASETLSGSGVT